jgi:hypothetical protein
MNNFVTETVFVIVDSATELLGSLGDIFTSVIALIYDGNVEAPTALGTILLVTAGFSLAWSGIRFIFGFVSRLLNKTRAGR